MKKIFNSKFFRSSLSLCIAAIMLLCITACGPKNPGGESGLSGDHVDYATSIKLDMASGKATQEVTVHAYVDGDTTHFNVPTSVMPGGILKARYLGINTPESTGKIEEWGKAAAEFTKNTLKNATSIVLESDTANWDADSTGGRYLVWVWYKTKDSDEYRNLNVEILQNGLAIASSSANNTYGEVCMNAINQAKAEKLNVHSNQKDPNFPYGEATELTLKELRCNIESYSGQKVAFEGVITKNNANTVYVEDYDSETGLYFGMQVYYGYALNGSGLKILSVGNRVRIVGSVQYYETGGTYQVSGLEYSPMRPDDPNNIKKISEGHSPAYVPTTADKLNNGKVEISLEEGNVTLDYDALSIYTSVEMKNLKVVDTYTTKNEESSSKGAMTLTCMSGSEKIAVRTIVLYDDNGNLVTEDKFAGKTINVKGLVDYFDGSYQIKVYSVKDITIL